MKKSININTSILILSALLFITLFITPGKIFADRGVNIINNSGQDILVKVDKMTEKNWITIPPTGTKNVPTGTKKFIPTKDYGKRGVYWTVDKTNYYVTPKYSYPDIIEIKKNGKFDMTESIGGGALKLDKLTHRDKNASITNLAGVESYMKDTESDRNILENVVELPAGVVNAAKEALTIINNLEIVSQELLKESKKIKDAAATIGTKKLIHEKITLLKNIIGGEKKTVVKDGKSVIVLGTSVREFISMGVYPIMDPIAKLLSITANNIVDPITQLLSTIGKEMPGVFDKKTKNTLIDTSDLIQGLTKSSGQTFKSYSGTTITKDKNNKSIGECVDIVIRALTHIENSLKNTQYFKN